MRYSELAVRYSNSLFDISIEDVGPDRTFNEILSFQSFLDGEKDIKSFFESPLIQAQEKEGALREALTKADLSGSTQSFLLLLAKKDRISLLPEIVAAFQERTDADHGVTRGQVRSALVLGPQQRQELEKTLQGLTGKKVILTFKEDPELIGGVVAEVGSYTFDDSLKSHLNRLSEEINRSVQ